jgi:hypothetical protein
MSTRERAELAVSKAMQEIDYNPDRAEEPIMLEVFAEALRAHEAETIERCAKIVNDEREKVFDSKHPERRWCGGVLGVTMDSIRAMGKK